MLRQLTAMPLFYRGKLDGMLTDYPGATLLQAKGSRLRLVMETDGSLSLIASKKAMLGIRTT